LRSATPGFKGFREGIQRRGQGDKGDVGERQQRRIAHELINDFEKALSKACPSDLEEGFRVLESSQRFQSKYQPAMEYRFKVQDKVTQELIRLYGLEEGPDVLDGDLMLALVCARRWVHETSLLDAGQRKGDPIDLADKTSGGPKLGLCGERRFAARTGRAGIMKTIKPGVILPRPPNPEP